VPEPMVRPRWHSVAVRCKTHSGMLPQSRTLEVLIADNLRGVDETDEDLSSDSNMAERRR